MSPSKVTEPKAFFDHFGTLVDRGTDSSRFSPGKRPFSATPEERLPVLPVLVTLNPIVDRPGLSTAVYHRDPPAPVGPRSALETSTASRHDELLD